MKCEQPIHLIGIGGAGMSAIAIVLAGRGVRVKGSDIKESNVVQRLREIGIPVEIGHDASHVHDAGTIVYSSAIRDDNPELREARKRKITCLRRSEILARLEPRKRLVAVSGTHGKTTTTSMIVFALKRLGHDPSFIVGGELNDIGTNAGCGDGDVFVVEADESDGTFLSLDPFVAVVTNVENDHLDFFGGVDAIEASFKRFIGNVSADGRVVIGADDRGAARIGSELVGREVVSVGTGDGADIRAIDVRPDMLGSRFRVERDGRVVCDASLAVPGAHNIRNALAAAAACETLGIEIEDVLSSLEGFTGVRRRFQIRGEVDGVTVVDDYAHHPTEIKATIEAARASGFNRVISVFQPHRYSRTGLLLEEFPAAFSPTDWIVLTDIYPAGENPIPGVMGRRLLEEVAARSDGKRIAYIPQLLGIPGFIASIARHGDAVLTLGAGDITMIAGEIVENLENR